MRDRIVQPAPAAAKAAKPAADGQSAFELARSKGYRGTLEQWLASLKGEPGQRGPRGLKGADGGDGRDLALVPSDAIFERDEVTKYTERVTVVDDGGAVLLTLTPLRDADGFMTHARIQPALVAG